MVKITITYVSSVNAIDLMRQVKLNRNKRLCHCCCGSICTCHAGESGGTWDGAVIFGGGWKVSLVPESSLI